MCWGDERRGLEQNLSNAVLAGRENNQVERHKHIRGWRVRKGCSLAPSRQLRWAGGQGSVQDGTARQGDTQTGGWVDRQHSLDMRLRRVV
jgi:hypothetical protein